MVEVVLVVVVVGRVVVVAGVVVVDVAVVVGSGFFGAGLRVVRAVGLGRLAAGLGVAFLLTTGLGLVVTLG